MNATKPKSHGILRVSEKPEPSRPWIPKALRDVVVIHVGGMSPEEEHRKYGTWHMRALKTCCLFGRIIEIGEDFKIAGNAALNLAHGRDAEFLDTDGLKKKEEEFEATAKELCLPVDYQTAPQFSDFPDAAPLKAKANFR